MRRTKTKSIKTLTLALGLSSLFAFSACGSDDPLAKANKVVDDMCACKDMECVAKVGKAADKSMNEEKMAELGKAKPKETAALKERMGKCVKAIMGGGK